MNHLANSLRLRISVGWVVAWNVLIGIGFWINGGFTPPLRSHIAQLFAGTALFGSACFAVAIAVVPKVSAWALRSGHNSDAIRKELWFVAFLTAALGVGMCVSSLGHASV
jgi:hypothetical protein